MLKRVLKVSILACLLFTIYAITTINFAKINEFQDNMLITQSEIENINQNGHLGKFIKIKKNTSNVVYASSSQEFTKSEISINFLLFPIKTLPVTMIEQSEVCVGGNAVGLVLTTNGAVIVGFNALNTSNGKISPFEKSIFKVGDRIVKIGGEKVSCIKDIEKISETFTGEKVEIVAMRKEKEISQEIEPLYDTFTKCYKLGLWVRDDAAGVGTLTFVNDKNNRFGALGHAICDSNSGGAIPVSGGSLYSCDIVGINKGGRGKAGELKGFFVNGRNKQGDIDKNCEYGVFGSISDKSVYLKNRKVQVGGRLSVKPGKAKILCCLDGKEVKEYDIEIIKTNYQRKSNDKSLVIRVVDKELIEKTGGIVQGMSGSPILQNGKIVGAVTHVFVNDPLKGFGIYMDWMYNE